MSHNGADKDSGQGGGLTITGTATLTDCTVDYNVADLGGGIQIWGTVTLINSTIEHNKATEGGGAIDSLGDTTLTDCAINRNRSGGAGGGIYIESGTATLSNCAINRD